jgi:hypothetical protein
LCLASKTESNQNIRALFEFEYRKALPVEAAPWTIIRLVSVIVVVTAVALLLEESTDLNIFVVHQVDCKVPPDDFNYQYNTNGTAI